MGKPQVYINVSQCAAVIGVTAVGLYYIKTLRDAVGIQKAQVKEKVKNDAGNFARVITTPFRHYF